MNNDNFVFRSTKADLAKKRAYLGNGYFGIDVSNNVGQGFGICEMRDPFPTTILGGVYTFPYGAKETDAPRSLFRPMNVHCLVPAAQDLDNATTELENFSQELDMKNAVARTKGSWHGYETETTIFTSRHRPNIGVMKITSSGHADEKHELIHAVRKDPRVKYESLAFDGGEKIAMFDCKIIEDRKQFHGGGPFRVIQATAIQAVDSIGHAIPFKTTWEARNAADIGFDGEASFVNHVSLDCQGPFSIVVYFAIYKETDMGGDLRDHARASLAEAMASGFDALLDEHAMAWQADIWSRLIVVTDDKLQRRIIASMYAMGCSFKSGINNSAGPNGLNGFGWDGHVFWDADLWVNLGIIMWAPELSRCITAFRFSQIDGARKHREDYAALCGYDQITSGIKFPWEATTSGLERAPQGWSAQEHITCDVIFGQYLQYTVTKDERYLKDAAFPIVYEACKYLAQRVEKGKDGKYHFLEVIPADEHVFPGRCDDNAFTNLYTGICIGIGIDWCAKLKVPCPPEWKEIRDHMFYNFDEKRQLVLEYTGYKGQPIKQADTDLLTFPLEYPFPDAVKRNNMLYYFDKLPKNHIMMSSSIFSIVACELGMAAKAVEYFEDLFLHFHEDQFYIASESPVNECWPFITGLGGFLANLVYGFGGIRLRDDGLLVCPFLPETMPEITFSKLVFQGTPVRYRVFDRGTRFSLTAIHNKCTMVLHFKPGKEFTCKAAMMNQEQADARRNEERFTVILPRKKVIVFELKT
nr:hypothetical protein [Candidatus Sigynarchaeota archaeon]